VCRHTNGETGLSALEEGVRVRRTWKLSVAVAIASLVAVGGGVAAAADPAPSATITPVVTGLDNPRGLALDGQGSLYVAEAGQWQGTMGVNGPTGEGATSTGRVTKWSHALSTPTKAWSNTFASLYDSEHGPEVLGPGGVAATGNGCWKQAHGRRNGCQAYVILNESNAGIKAATGMDVPQIGHLYRFDAAGTARSVSDVGDQQYAWTDANKAVFPSDFPDSNPYGVLVTSDRRVFVADAGANTISEVLRDGTTRVIAYIPNETAPPFRDSTPTCIAQGPDGALYVGTLDFISNLVVNGPGQSHVYRVDPNTTEDIFAAGSHVWADGLTTVTSCTFDRQGNFVATEMFQPAAGPPGDIVRIPWTGPTSHGAIERLGGGQLPLPGGIAAARDGSLFVSINSTSGDVGSGAVVRVKIGS
jgi:hypothetical protein